MIPCVGALIRDDAGRLLLVRRGRAPSAGTWSLPGGRVEPGETTYAAVVREVLEETALVVVPERVVGEVERPSLDGTAEHCRPTSTTYVIVDVRCRWVGGRLRAGDDAAEARFVSYAALRELELSPGLFDTLREWDELPGPGADPPEPR